MYSTSAGHLLTDWLLTLLTLLPSSWSSSLMELEGDGVADLLAGGDGEVWVMLGPAMFRLNCALSWDWLMVVSWFLDNIPLGLFMLMMDFITMAGLGGYWRRWPGPTFCKRNQHKSLLRKQQSNVIFHWSLSLCCHASLQTGLDKLMILIMTIPERIYNLVLGHIVENTIFNVPLLHKHTNTSHGSSLSYALFNASHIQRSHILHALARVTLGRLGRCWWVATKYLTTAWRTDFMLERAVC